MEKPKPPTIAIGVNLDNTDDLTRAQDGATNKSRSNSPGINININNHEVVLNHNYSEKSLSCKSELNEGNNK